MNERRKFIRIVEATPIRLIAANGSAAPGKMVDLSLRGLRFTASVELSDGERIRTVFSLGSGISLDLAGVIRHSGSDKAKKKIYGMEFFIQDYRDLKEHLKLNSYILRARAEQDEILKKEISKRRKG